LVLSKFTEKLGSSYLSRYRSYWSYFSITLTIESYQISKEKLKIDQIKIMIIWTPSFFSRSLLHKPY